MVKIEDYQLWGTLYVDNISDKGNWVSYRMDYNEHPDTLFVKRANGKAVYKFPGASEGVFCGERQFAVPLPDKTLSVLNLVSFNATTIAGVERFSFSGDGAYIVMLCKMNGQSFLEIRDVENHTVRRIGGVSDYKQDKDGMALVYCQGGTERKTVSLLFFKTVFKEKEIAETITGSYSNFVWQQNGATLAFLRSSSQEMGNAVCYYDIARGNTTIFETRDFPEIPKDKIIGGGFESLLEISRDGKKVVFGLVDRKPTQHFSRDSVQVWNGNDTLLYPEQQSTAGFSVLPRIAVWWPASGRMEQVTNDDRPFVFFDALQDCAITFNPAVGKPQYKDGALTDYYKTDLESGITSIWLKNQSSGGGDMSVSPVSGMVAYFSAGDWWLHDLQSGKTVNMTGGKVTDLQNPDDSGDATVYGIAGWSTDGRTLLFYDRFDLWEYSFKTGELHRLTKGRETNTVYRQGYSAGGMLPTQDFDGIFANGVNRQSDVILEVVGDSKSGYSALSFDNKIRPILSGEFRVRDVVGAKSANRYAFTTQRYDRPPDLKVTGKDYRTRQIFQSNAFYEQFLWGKAVRIAFSDALGILRKGVLYYPAGYDAAKKYPMVVHVYENQSGQLHNYRNPNLYLGDGFSISNFTTSGYFVLLPDIDYQNGSPGISAAGCVIAAVEHVIAMGIVQPGKIGLMGHSFGGYETNFILTQTDLFAAAISGAGVSDLRSFYLSVGFLGVPEFWRFERQQWRMGKTMFEDRTGYERNSPISQAEKINTPLLLWAGEQDAIINSRQSVAFYLALKRLDKRPMLLIYPGEGHGLLVPNYQKDLALRIMDWFNYYLKDHDPKTWIANGIK